MKRKLLLVFGLMVVLGCQTLTEGVSIVDGTSTKLTEEAAGIISVSDEDEEMNAAIQQAQDTLDDFIADLQAPKAGQTYYSIKAMFPYSNGNEHIWLYDISYSDRSFVGFIGNKPEYVDDLELDDEVTVTRDDVSDWMIVQDGKVVGGFTVRVLFNRMSPEEQEQFIDETGIVFDN